MAIQIKNLLDKYLVIKNDSSGIKSAIQEFLKENLKISIEPKNISINKGTVFLKTSPFQKIEMLIKRKEIVEFVNKTGFKIKTLK